VDVLPIEINSPKRLKHDRAGWEGFFPYYAGYPARFALDVIRSAALPPRSSVLDPWNGSGTTTFAAAQLGHSAIGFDMNPVMVIIARARMLPASEADSLVPLAREIVKCARKKSYQTQDPLSAWFSKDAAFALRAIEQSIQRHLVGVKSLANLERISSIAATFYAALFAVARELTVGFQSSNPTWLRVPRDGEVRVEATKNEIAERFHQKISTMSCALTRSNKSEVPDVALVACRLGDSTALGLRQNSIDFILGSPPYCTRIDYTAATRIELAILYGLVSFDVKELSQKMIGTTRVPRLPPLVQEEWGPTCAAFLNEVRSHPSKASGGYYLKTHSDYFAKMWKSIAGLSAVLRPGGKMVLVAQDSFYKNIHNPLPDVLVEMGARCGLKLVQRNDFTSKRSMSNVNSSSLIYRVNGAPKESVLCFEK
jgi:SAM-dependent methyltransferase